MDITTYCKAKELRTEIEQMVEIRNSIAQKGIWKMEVNTIAISSSTQLTKNILDAINKTIEVKDKEFREL